ncbi:NADP-dependent malic enzyme [Phytophthora cinnamomi]|uniref:NADP-dependent malic enzyme n=1 Tax=Phytophthora cinnamomi TaxID=4785 RepID=UPI003559C8FD|nr:NADP-dependent malic enzyme [Phytophthora cinnamomi]
MNAAKAKYGDKNTHCTFNDDIQGAASVVLGGLLAAVPLSGKDISEQIFLFLGAGTSIIDLIAQAIAQATGKSVEDSG